MNFPQSTEPYAWSEAQCQRLGGIAETCKASLCGAKNSFKSSGHMSTQHKRIKAQSNAIIVRAKAQKALRKVTAHA